MGVSIYYSFKAKNNFKSSGFLQQIEKEWDQLFDDAPYETWTCYDPEIVSKKLFGKNIYKYEGQQVFC